MTQQLMPQIRPTIKLNTISQNSSTLLKKKSFSMKKLTLPLSPQKSSKLDEKEQQKQREVYSERRESRFMLKLSPIKQYETKLKISADSWLVYDYRKDSYERGWHPSSQREYNGMIRLVILKIFLVLLEQNPDLVNFQLRVNVKYLKQQIEELRQSKRPHDKKHGVLIQDAIKRGLQDSNYFTNADIVIGIIDLLFGIFMTNFDDMVEYSIIFMGYLVNCHTLGTNPISEQSPCHYVETIGESIAYGNYFAQFVNKTLFPNLSMQASHFDVRFNQFMTSANDVCRIFLTLEQSQLFCDIIGCKEKVCKVKKQVGFRYWENRILHLKNTRPNFGNNYLCTFNWKGKQYYSALSRNLHLNILTIFQDCRYGMVQRDVYHVEEWVKSLRKPIVDRRRTHNKLLPLLKPHNFLLPIPTSNSDEKIIEQPQQK